MHRHYHLSIVLGSALACATVPVCVSAAARPLHPTIVGVRPELVRNGVVSLVPWNHPVLHPSWMRSAPRAALPPSGGGVYVASFYNEPARRYELKDRKNRPPTCQGPDLLNGVNNIAVDRSGNLWVPEGNNGYPTGFTQEYAPNCGAAEMNIPDTTGQPSDVAFDSKGNIYVGDILDFDASYNASSGTVSVFTPAGSYVGQLTDPSFTSQNGALLLIGVAVDAHDNCYVSHFDPTGAGEVVEFPGCTPASQGKVLGGPHPWEPGKAQFDRAGNLLVADYAFYHDYRLESMSVYAPPYDGAPIRTFPLLGPAVTCPLDRAGKFLYCADFITQAVDVYSYKSGTYLYSFNNGMSGGVQSTAIDPAAKS